MKWRLLLVFIVTAAFTQQPCFAQGKTDSLLLSKDSTAVIDSLMKDFRDFVDSIAASKSFVTATVGIGNRTFSIHNNSLNTQEATTNSLSITPSIGYYHKSGLGITLTGFLSSLNNKTDLYQYAVTPSYDYITHRLSAGISYTRYFGKDMNSPDVSPYDNDWYAYFNLIRKSWRYGIAAGYATGHFSDQLSYKDSALRFNPITMMNEWIKYRVIVNSENKIKDLSLSVSVRRDIEWYKLFSANDNLTLSVTSYLVAGSSKINTTTTNNINLAVARKINLSRIRRTYNSTNGNDLQFQSAALTCSLYYTIGKFNVQPIWFMDYYFPDTDKKFSQVFSLSVGFTFW